MSEIPPLVIDEGVELTREASVSLLEVRGVEDELRHHRDLVEEEYRTAVLPMVGVVGAAVLRGDADMDAAARQYFSRPGAKQELDAAKLDMEEVADETPLEAAARAALGASKTDAPRFAEMSAMSYRPHAASDEVFARQVRFVKVLRVVRAVSRRLGKTTVEGGALRVRALTPEAEVITTARNCIVLDATAPIELLRKLRPDVHVIDLQVATTVKPRRTILYRGRVGRRALMPRVGINWDVVEPLVESILVRAKNAGVARLLLVTFKALAQAIGDPKSPLAPSLRSLIREGRIVEVRWYGSLRGQNRWEWFDGCATLGDPFKNLRAHGDEAELLGLDGDARDATYRQGAADELAQVHGRLRDVRRSDTPWHLHVGGTAPAGWTDQDTVVEQVKRGRPRNTAALIPTSAITSLVAVFGGLRAAAAAVGISHTTLRRYRDGTHLIPQKIAARIQRVLSAKGLDNSRSTQVDGADGTPIANRDLVGELPFHYTPRTPSPSDLAAAASSELAALAPEMPAAFDELAAHLEVDGSMSRQEAERRAFLCIAASALRTRLEVLRRTLPPTTGTALMQPEQDFVHNLGSQHGPYLHDL